MSNLLSDPEISARLEALEGWSREGAEILRQFSFRDFVAAMALADAVAMRAEAPTIIRISISAGTKAAPAAVHHSAGGLARRTSPSPGKSTPVLKDHAQRLRRVEAADPDRFSPGRSSIGDAGARRVQFAVPSGRRPAF